MNKILSISLSILFHVVFILIIMRMNLHTVVDGKFEMVDLEVSEGNKSPSVTTNSVKSGVFAQTEPLVFPQGVEKDGANEQINGESIITEEPQIISVPKNKHRTEEARYHGYTGTAKLKIFIDAKGQVLKAEMVNSLKYGLNERAIELAQQTRFSPAKSKGNPVSVIRNFTITFRAVD